MPRGPTPGTPISSLGAKGPHPWQPYKFTGCQGAPPLATPVSPVAPHPPDAPLSIAASLQGQGSVYFLTATLRSETFYGVTNAWVLPEGQYGAFRGVNHEIYIMSHRSALNLSYQDRMPVTGQPECLMTVSGQDLIGTPLKVRLCPSGTLASISALGRSTVTNYSINVCVLWGLHFCTGFGIKAEVGVAGLFTEKLQGCGKRQFFGFAASMRMSRGCLWSNRLELHDSTQREAIIFGLSTMPKGYIVLFPHLCFFLSHSIEGVRPGREGSGFELFVVQRAQLQC